jgi:adenine-specific DNA-methyltransferase
MADVYYQPDELTQDGLMLQVDNLKPGRNPEDLLFQVLLDWGVDLTLPISKEIFKVRKDEGRSMNYEVFFVAENALAACFDTGLDEDFVKELAKRQPLRAVFRDSSYASDAVKINFEQIFKALSPHTELKTL